MTLPPEAIERVAVAMWKQEAVRAAPPSVARNRTLEAFRKESEETRSRWTALAAVAARVLQEELFLS